MPLPIDQASPTLLCQLVQITGGAAHLVFDRPFRLGKATALLSDVLRDVFQDARTIAAARIPEMLRLGQLAHVPRLTVEPAVLELLWHQFSYLIECGLPPELIAGKNSEKSVDNYYFMLRAMYLARDGGLMRDANSLLSPAMMPHLLSSMSFALTFLYFQEVARSLYDNAETRRALVGWLAEHNLAPDVQHQEPLIAAFAASLLLNELAEASAEQTQQSWASIAIIWLNAIPLIDRWMAFDEETGKPSFKNFLASDASPTVNAMAMRRLSAVLRVHDVIVTSSLDALESMQTRLILERGLGSLGFGLPSVGLDYDGQPLRSIPHKYKWLSEDLSDFIRTKVPEHARESLDIPALAGLPRLHHYENPFYAHAVGEALAQFKSYVANVIPEVAALDLLASTMPVRNFNAMVLGKMKRNWPDGIVVISEGLCDMLWHTFSLLAFETVIVSSAEDIARKRAAEVPKDQAHLDMLRELLQSKHGSWPALYAKPSLGHSAEQKAILGISLENAHLFVVGHEVAHILYNKRDAQAQMQRYFEANRLEWPSGQTAEEEVCDIFSALILVNSKTGAESKALTFTSLLWATSLLSIPHWLTWQSTSGAGAETSFSAYLQGQARGTHPVGTRRFSSIVALVKRLIPDRDCSEFALLSGACIFRALGVDPRLVLEQESLDWPAEGTISAL